MDKTIQMMKRSGLFDSLVKNIHRNDMPIDAVAEAIDNICTIDENFEDTFFNDMHELAMGIIWGELMTAVNCLPTKGEQKEEPKYKVNFDNFEQVLMDKAVQMAMKKLEDLLDATIADVMKNNK